MKSITIDRSKPVAQQPKTGHNRWHPGIPPVLEADPGEEVVLETRDANDGQVSPATTAASMAQTDGTRVHPLTGPVYVKGAQPGDLLEIEFLDIIPEPWGYTGIMPGMGFLRAHITGPYIAHWRVTKTGATSPALPGVRIPAAPFMGISGVAPSRAQLTAWREREAALAARGGIAMPPDGGSAVPGGRVGREGLRTIPPRENGGNMDMKQLTVGAKLYLPVAVEGALFSTGDAHFAQGDGEVCLMAIEQGATVSVRFRVLAGEAKRKNIRWPRITRDGYFAPPRWAAPQRFTATVGMPVRADGTNESEDITLAARNALLNMVDLLCERGWSREQAYVICSVAVDLRISEVVDVPNVMVSALLPEDIFVG